MKARRLAQRLVMLAGLAIVGAEGACAATLVMKGSDVSMGLFPRTLVTPDGDVLHATEILGRAGHQPFLESDLLVYETGTGQATRIAQDALMVARSIELYDPRTTHFLGGIGTTTFGGDRRINSPKIDFALARKPGSFLLLARASVSLIPTTTAGMTLPGAPSRARFGGGVTANGGKSYNASSYDPADAVVVRFFVEPEPSDVGKRASFYLLGTLDGALFMRDTGGHWQPWDGRVESLVPASAPKVLEPLEIVDVSASPLATFAGSDFQFLVAYTTEPGEIHFNWPPVSFSVTE